MGRAGGGGGSVGGVCAQWRARNLPRCISTLPSPALHPRRHAPHLSSALQKELPVPCSGNQAAGNMRNGRLVHVKSQMVVMLMLSVLFSLALILLEVRPITQNTAASIILIHHIRIRSRRLHSPAAPCSTERPAFASLIPKATPQVFTYTSSHFHLLQ